MVYTLWMFTLNKGVMRFILRFCGLALVNITLIKSLIYTSEYRWKIYTPWIP